MGSVDLQLASDLKAAVGIQRAVETGTYRGRTARALATVFGAVVTIELSVELHQQAEAALRDTPAITALQGHSSQVLRDVADPATPTLFFLDGHWSAGSTAGADDECPVLDEIAAIGASNPADCLVIDDAHWFAASPPPPHKASAWPTLTEVFDAVRAQRPDHHVTLIADQVIAVPAQGRDAVNEYAHRMQRDSESLVDRAKGVAFNAREKLVHRR